MYDNSKNTARGSIWVWFWPSSSVSRPTGTGDVDVGACGSFSYSCCADPEAGDITPVYAATLAGVFSFLTTDAVTRGPCEKQPLWEVRGAGGCRDLRGNAAQCHGWCGIPGTLRSFSHTFLFLTKEPEKLNVTVCVFSKKRLGKAFSKSRSLIHWFMLFIC